MGIFFAIVFLIFSLIMAAHSSHNRSGSAVEGVINYLNALLSFAFSVGSVLALLLTYADKYHNFWVILALSMIAPMAGIILAHWAMKKTEKLEIDEAVTGTRKASLAVCECQKNNHTAS